MLSFFHTVYFIFINTTHIFAATDNYTPLQPLPIVSDGRTSFTGVAYIPAIFQLIIGSTTILAVIWIVIGGIQYMSTDAWSGKSEGKNKVKNALLGLLLAGASWLILNEINPDILNIKFPAQADTTSIIRNIT